MLSQALKMLEAYGFVARRSFDVVPPHVEYSLTEHGLKLALHLRTLVTWPEGALPDLPPDQELFVARLTGQAWWRRLRFRP